MKNKGLRVVSLCPEFNPLCRACIAHCLALGEDSDGIRTAPPCVAYREEEWHWDRMNKECRITRAFFEMLFGSFSEKVETELNKKKGEE